MEIRIVNQVDTGKPAGCGNQRNGVCQPAARELKGFPGWAETGYFVLNGLAAVTAIAGLGGRPWQVYCFTAGHQFINDELASCDHGDAVWTGACGSASGDKPCKEHGEGSGGIGVGR